MPILDDIKDAVTKAIPQKRQTLPLPGSTGVGHGVYRGEDLILRKTFIVASSFQIFLSFLAMCCFAGVASFQARYGVGPSALSGIAIFDSLVLLFLAIFLLVVPVVYDRYDKLKSLAQALRVIRVALICNGIGIFFSLITAFATTISVFTEAGCKDPKTDPSAGTAGKDFVAGLPGWCQTKRAGAVFFWLTMLAWIGTMFLTFQEWRTGKTIYRPEDPPFSLAAAHQPVVHDEDDTDPYSARNHTQQRTGITEEDDEYDDNDAHSPFADHTGNNRYNAYGNANVAGRPSMDAYGAFSDPNPSGYGGVAGGRQQQQPPQYTQPEMSRTMQFADPYAAVRASIHTNTPPPAMPQPPPAFDGYQR